MAINEKYSYNGIDLERKKADRIALDEAIAIKRQEIIDSPETRTGIILRQIKNLENDYNDKWKNETSPKFKRKQFLDVDPAEFSNSTIMNTDFRQHEPYTRVFPDGIENLEFKNCILDNCIIPDKAIVGSGCLNRHYKTQNDGEYWFVDTELRPISPKNYGRFDFLGLSKNPADIPAEPLSERITVASDPRVIEQREFEAFKNDETRLRSALSLERAGSDSRLLRQ